MWKFSSYFRGVANWKSCLPHLHYRPGLSASSGQTGQLFCAHRTKECDGSQWQAGDMSLSELMAGWLNDNPLAAPSPSRAPSDDRKQTPLWHFSLISIISIRSLCGRTVAWQGSKKGYSVDLWWTTPAVRNYPFHRPKGWRQRPAPHPWNDVACTIVFLPFYFLQKQWLIDSKKKKKKKVEGLLRLKASCFCLKIKTLRDA